jgi:preprotein translocase subunit SecE
MNRQVKRAMQRRQQSPDRLQVARRQQLEAKKRRRVGPRQFLREVRAELRKVAWPGRREMVAYTLVVLFTVVVLTAYVFGVDFLVGKGVLWVFGRGS